VLSVIAEIRDTSMDMELRIAEAQEQFRVLRMYSYEIDPEDQEEVDQIGENWAELVEKANRKDHEVGKQKELYAKIT